MHDDDPRLLKLTRAIADGTHVDWGRVDAVVEEPEERALFEALRELAHIAWFHRLQQLASADGPHSGPGETPEGPASGSPRGTGAGAVSPAREGPPPTPASGSGAAAASSGRRGATSEAPRRWGHLEMREKIGEGVFGEVYRAWETTLDREVALKLLRSDASLAARQSGLAPQLLQEARHLARVRHPNVVTVFGAEQFDGRVGIWMEFVRGRTLESILQSQGPFGAREAVLIGIDLCRALTAVHQANLLHRDIKANNVMREAGGRIVLMDFGAGVDLRQGAAIAQRTPCGTPVYLAPEAFLGRPAGVQSDIYSLGVLMYHLVTGKFPVEGDSLREIARVHERGEARILREERSDLPPIFVQTVERALHPRPEERFASAGQFERSLAAALV